MNRALPLVVGLAVALSACYGLTDDEWARVQVWLHCEECDSTMLAYVDSLGTVRERETISVLDRALSEGPSEKQRANMRYKLAAGWSRIESNVDPSLTLDTYVRHYVDNYVAGYRIQAATALSAIGTERAVDRLREAVEESDLRGYRDDVARHVAREYATAAYDTFGGHITSPVGFLEPVRVLPDPAAPWTGDESVVLPGAPFPDAAVVDRWGGDSLEFVAGAWPGLYQVVVTGLGPDDSLRAPLTVRTSRYSPHPRSSPLDLGVLATPRRVYSALTGSLTLPAGDVASGRPTDHFELRAQDDTAVLAILDWTGNAATLPTWHSCDALPMPGGIAGTVFDARGDAGPFGAIEVVGVGPAVPVDSLGNFHVSTGDGPTYELSVWVSPTARRSVPDMPSPSAGTLIYLPQHDGDPYRLSRPDTSVVHLSAGGCAVLRVAKLDKPEEPAMVSLVLYPVPRTRRVEISPSGPIQLRTQMLGQVARLSIHMFDYRDLRLQRPVVWRSLDPEVATVGPDGWVVARDTGSTQIFAFTSGVPPVSVEVKVDP